VTSLNFYHSSHTKIFASKMNSIGLLLACIAFAIVGVESQCTDESVRVVWGPGPWEGNVQICYGGVWGWVCHNNFGTPDAKVVCTQLGYTSAGKQCIIMV
jgi:deleted-in-malignant-brain-tumors protein 1